MTGTDLLPASIPGGHARVAEGGETLEEEHADGRRCRAVRLTVRGDWDLGELAELLSPKSGSEECRSAFQKTLARARKASGEKGRSSLSMVYLAVLLRHIGRGAS